MMDSKRVVFLTKIADGNGNDGNEHLARRRIPAPYLDTQLEAEIVNGQIQRNDRYIPEELTNAVQVRLRERHIFLQPETREKRYRKNDTQRRYMRSNG